MEGRNRWFLAAAMTAVILAGPTQGQDKGSPPKAAAPAAAAPAAAPAPVAIDTLKRIKDTGAILVGVRESSVPFSFLDAQKQPQGYSVDLCLRVADAVKSELKMPKLD